MAGVPERLASARSAVEQACLAQVIADRHRTRVFAWYNVAGYAATALGALAGGTGAAALQRAGWSILAAEIRYLAKNFVELNGPARKEVADFLNALDDHDDVHRVYAAMK